MRQPIRRLYPGGRSKAFNITFDDSVMQDARFVALLNRYGIKGTFNLNSRLMDEGFTWVHPSGMVIRRLPAEAVKELYQGHEVACHTATHPNLEGLSEEQLLWELSTDKARLEAIFGHTIEGFAIPFHYYSPLVEHCVKQCGFTYARISEESGSFSPYGDRYRWRSGIFHLNPGFRDFVEDFLWSDEELAFCQIVGHSYDLDTENLWETIEDLLAKVSAATDVLPMTNLEFIRYREAMNLAQFTDRHIHNLSSETLWFGVEGQIIAIPPGACKQIRYQQGLRPAGNLL